MIGPRTSPGLHEDDAYADLGGGRHEFYREGKIDTGESQPPKKAAQGSYGYEKGKRMEERERREAGLPMDVPPAEGMEQIYKHGAALARQAFEESGNPPAPQPEVFEQPKLPLE